MESEQVWTFCNLQKIFQLVLVAPSEVRYLPWILGRIFSL